MVNQDILEGLRNALSRGYSLKIAMTSFYNAGYKKQEIEEAARVLHEHPSHPMSHPEKPISKEVEKTVKKPLSLEHHPQYSKKQVLQTKAKKISKTPSIFKKKSETPETKKLIEKKPDKQLISKYEQKQKPKSKFGLILIIIALLIILLGVITVILFREEVLDLIKSLF